MYRNSPPEGSEHVPRRVPTIKSSGHGSRRIPLFSSPNCALFPAPLADLENGASNLLYSYRWVLDASRQLRSISAFPWESYPVGWITSIIVHRFLFRNQAQVDHSASTPQRCTHRSVPTH